MEMLMRSRVCGMTMRRLVNSNRRFGPAGNLHLQGLSSLRRFIFSPFRSCRWEERRGERQHTQLGAAEHGGQSSENITEVIR